jgi:hypothetical protein
MVIDILCRQISRRDVELGRVAEKTIVYGTIAVPPGLQVNVESLVEHQDRMRREGRNPVTATEAESMGYGPGEIGEYFGG